MESINLHLLNAKDATDSYVLAAEGDAEGPPWKAERGYGSALDKAWSVELKSRVLPDLRQVDWDVVLDRMIEAYDLNDPEIAGFEWPLRSLSRR